MTRPRPYLIIVLGFEWSDSPEMSIQELDKELILYLNKTDKVESYEEVDPIILSYGFSEEEAKYRFQGYQFIKLKMLVLVHLNLLIQIRLG